MRNLPFAIRQRIAQWLLRGVHLPEVHFGKESITCSPAGVGDVVRWSATQLAVAAGDIGMDVATGRPSVFVGGVATPLATSTDSAFAVAFGNSSISAGADTRFLDTWYNQATAPTVATSNFVSPRAGTLRNLFVRHNVALGNGNSVVYTVMINGVASAVTVTLPTGAAGQVSDLVNTVAVAQGDLVALRAVKALAIGNGTQEVTSSMLIT